MKTILLWALEKLAKGAAMVALFFWVRKADDEKQRADALQKKNDVITDISRMSDDDKRRMLDKWASSDVRGINEDRADER